MSELANHLADLRAIARASIEYRDSEDFAPTDWLTLPNRLGWLDSEVGELVSALEAHRAACHARAQPWTTLWALRCELADCAMLATQILEDLFPGKWTARLRYHGSRRIDSPAEVLVAPLDKHRRQAFEAWQHNRPRDVQIAIELFVCALCDLRARLVPGDLFADVVAKIDSMRDRPRRHGKLEVC